VFAPSVRPGNKATLTFSLYTLRDMEKPAPKKSALPPARIGLLVIVEGVALYGAITLMG
jgi:hypothetical protein